MKPRDIRIALAPGSDKELRPGDKTKIADLLGVEIEEVPPDPGEHITIVCNRVDDAKAPVAGASSDRCCRYCDERVWLAPSSQALVARIREPAPWLVCTHCLGKLDAELERRSLS